MNEIKIGENHFYIGKDESKMDAEIHYVPNGTHQIIVNHTYVSDDLRDAEIGTKLVETIVNYARDTNKKIVPLCPFVKAKIQKNSEWHDVLS